MATDHNFRVKNGLEVGGVLIVNSSGQLQAVQAASHLHFLDHIQAKFGNSNDGTIHHDGSHFRLRAGTGNFNVQANDFHITDASNSAVRFVVDHDGETRLYHNGNVKLTTTSSGASVTGDLSVSGDLNITGDINSVSVTDLDVVDKTITVGQGQAASNSTGSGLVVSGSNANMLWDNSEDRWEFNKDIHTSGGLEFESGSNRIYGSGDGNHMHFDVPTALIGPSTTTANNPSLGTSSYRFDGLWSSTGNFSGNVTIAGADVDIASIIRHIGDTDTFFGFHGNNLWRVATGGVERFEVGDTGIRVNDTGADMDFTIESNNDANMFFVDGGNNRIGIGTSSPAEKLHVYHTGTATYDDIAKFEYYDTDNSTLRYQAMLGPNGGTFFKSLVTGANPDFKIIDQDHQTGRLSFQVQSNAGAKELLAVDSGGNVGIGTTSPDLKLDVSHGTTTEYVATFQNTADNLELKIGTTTGALLNIQGQIISSSAAYNIGLQADGGNVGIGTAGPDAKLHVKNNSSGNFVEAIRIENSGGGANEGGYINWEVANTSGHGARIGGRREGTGGIGLHFYTGEISSAPAERMRISHDGNVGIGTTSPSDPLVVQSTGTMGGGATNANSYFTVTDGTYGLYHDPNEIFSDINGTFHIGANHSNGALRFQTGGTSARMDILANGNVGIGTTNPQDYLNIHDSSSSANLGIKITRGSQTHGLRLGVNDSHAFLWTSENQNLAFATSGTERMTIASAGNVGIGTNNPIQKLQVVGSIYSNGGNLFLDSGNKLIWGNSQQWIQCSNGGQMKFIIANGERVYFQTDSRIETRIKKHFRIDDVSNLGTTIRYYKIATVNKGNSGITIKGTLANHVESFGTCKFDLAIFGREDNNGANISVAGTVDVSHPNAGVRIVKQSGSGTYIQYDVYIVVPKYCHADVEATIHGNSNGTGNNIDWHGNNTYVTTAPTGAAIELDSSSLAAGHYQVTDSVISDAILDVPAAPSITSTTVVNETIELVFGQSATTGVDHYEVHSDGATGSDYSLIARIPPEDIASSMSVVDASFDDSGTVAYRVYAVKNGVYSSPATTTRSFSMPSLDVSNMSVVPDTNSYHIQYNLPSTRFLDHVEIYVDAEASNSNLARSGASLIYSGSNPSFKYNISSSDMEKYHQFWVECVSV